MTWYYPGSKTLSPSQIASLWKDIHAPSNVGHAFAYGIAPDESAGTFSTGVVYNTAYPSLPNYAGPPKAGNLPEYSVGLYQLNLYDTFGPNGAQQAYQAGAQLATNPKAQTVGAAQKFATAGFKPWQGDSWVQSQGGPTAALASLGYASPPAVPVGTTGSLSGTSTSTPATGTSTSGTASTSGVLGPCSGCLVPIPLFGGCLFSRCNAKALIGGVMILAGGVTMIVGIAVLAKGMAPKAALSMLQGSAPPTAPASVPKAPSAPSAPAEPDYDAELAAYNVGRNDALRSLGIDESGQARPGVRTVAADEDEF